MLSNRYQTIIEEVASPYHGLPLSQVTVAHYERIAAEAADNSPSERVAEAVVRTAVSLELSEMIALEGLAARLASPVGTEVETSTFDT